MHDLPSARHLADFHGFFTKATFNRDGTATLIFNVPAEMKEQLLAISTNDGMALNVSVWETKMPEGEAWLADLLGLNDTDEPETKIVAKG